MISLPGQKAYRETELIEKKNRVTVNILGEEYTIRSDADPDHVKELAGLVDERMRSALAMNPRLSRGQAAILVCLSLADDLKKARRRYEELMRLVEDIR
ncbi:MAG TPA: cell division protein ZapA [Firmicutes bacterium]|nr:cell division protein ZapA [Bacillota bacterium]HCD41401.1 cell division protein ZapA [Bacillota bacterium]